MKRGFFCYLWLHAPFVESIETNLEDYGNELTEDDTLVSTITTKDVIADDFPVPCSCLKCAEKTCTPAV